MPGKVWGYVALAVGVLLLILLLWFVFSDSSVDRNAAPPTVVDPVVDPTDWVDVDLPDIEGNPLAMATLDVQMDILSAHYSAMLIEIGDVDDAVPNLINSDGWAQMQANLPQVTVMNEVCHSKGSAFALFAIKVDRCATKTLELVASYPDPDAWSTMMELINTVLATAVESAAWFISNIPSVSEAVMNSYIESGGTEAFRITGSEVPTTSSSSSVSSNAIGAWAPLDRLTVGASYTGDVFDSQLDMNETQSAYFDVIVSQEAAIEGNMWTFAGTSAGAALPHYIVLRNFEALCDSNLVDVKLPYYTGGDFVSLKEWRDSPSMNAVFQNCVKSVAYAMCYDSETDASTKERIHRLRKGHTSDDPEIAKCAAYETLTIPFKIVNGAGNMTPPPASYTQLQEITFRLKVPVSVTANT